MIIPDSDEIRNIMNNVEAEVMPDRLEEAAPGKAEIEAVTSGDELVRMMRRKQDPLNYYTIVKKAMELESDVVPEVLRRFKTNRTEEFIEIATQVLAKSKMNMINEIVGWYDEMKDPYAQSNALILLGFKCDESHIPWFISKYHELKKQYPKETYYLGAYYALWEIEMRFYSSD